MLYFTDFYAFASAVFYRVPCQRKRRCVVFYSLLCQRKRRCVVFYRVPCQRKRSYFSVHLDWPCFGVALVNPNGAGQFGDSAGLNMYTQVMRENHNDRHCPLRLPRRRSVLNSLRPPVCAACWFSNSYIDAVPRVPANCSLVMDRGSWLGPLQVRAAQCSHVEGTLCHVAAFVSGVNPRV